MVCSRASIRVGVSSSVSYYQSNQQRLLLNSLLHISSTLPYSWCTPSYMSSRMVSNCLRSSVRSSHGTTPP
jgi:hypothetical protein